VKINVHIFVFYVTFDRIVLLLFRCAIIMKNSCTETWSYDGSCLWDIWPQRR